CWRRSLTRQGYADPRNDRNRAKTNPQSTPEIQVRLQRAYSARRDAAHYSERKPDGRAASLSPKQERHEQAFPLAGDVHPEKAVRYNARVADDEALLSSESHADARRVLGGYQGLG